ncbi:type VI secretion system tube protein IglC [Facilibium subflavum]|uniref:type VI secretion system tube protein IglC n=1 Tax=Facilibium subflavum TaxID=2219058 RepID=UPI000E6540FD|nr:type VI secretion system tube protein IglC [Facilibium subflavum]
MSEQGQIERHVVLDDKPLTFKTSMTAFADSNTETRVWIDKITIFGEEFNPALTAREGGQPASEVKGKQTAAAVIGHFYLAGPKSYADCQMTLGIPMTLEQRVKLIDAIKGVKNGSNTDQLITLGKTNEKQELKQSGEDKAWGGMCDLSELVLRPIDPQQIDDPEQIIDEGHILGGASDTKAKFYVVSFRGLMVDNEKFTKDSIPVEHTELGEKGEYELDGVKSA